MLMYYQVKIPWLLLRGFVALICKTKEEYIIDSENPTSKVNL